MIVKASLIVLDDWGLTAFSIKDRSDLLEILDDRVNAGSTLIASQLPVDAWHAYRWSLGRDRLPSPELPDCRSVEVHFLPRRRQGGHMPGVFGPFTAGELPRTKWRGVQ
jgi:hypothetical protein